MKQVTLSKDSCWSLENALSAIKKGPFLALDWGKRYSGLALSDPDNTVALPLCVVQTGGVLRARLADLWTAHHVQALIIGWPLNMAGHESPLCAPITRFAQRLQQDHDWSIAFWDERLSSRGVAAMTCGMHNKHSRDDHHAAALILQAAIKRWRDLHYA